MTSNVDRRGEYWNRSSSEFNQGNAGKLSDEQLEERARLHATRLATGHPTLKEICEHWQKAYGISMHYNSEKEWGWRNEGKIQAAMDAMIEKGEVEKPLVSGTSFLMMVSKEGKGSSAVGKTIELLLKSTLGKIDVDFNAWAKILPKGISVEDLDPEERKAYEPMVAREEHRNSQRVKLATQLSGMLSEHRDVTLKAMKLGKDMYDASLMVRGRAKREGERKIASQAGQLSEENILDAEISDEDREAHFGAD